MAMNYKILSYNKKYRQAFYDLNAAWIEKYFVMEPVDIKVLSDPETYIVNTGGNVFYAVDGDTVIGAIALMNQGDGKYELTKLAVDPKTHKSGAGTALCKKVIETFQTLDDGKLLFLESNSILTDARRLYDRLGFIEKPLPADAPYERADYYMEWEG